MNFRAWYTDDRVFDGASAEDWKALPSEGVVWVTVYRSTGRTFYNGGDWYWIKGETIEYIPSEAWGTHAPKPAGCVDCIKRGDGVTDEEFERVTALAQAHHGHV